MDDAKIQALERPHKNLLILYFLQSLPALIAFPIVFLPLYFKYHTLRYKLDDEGISASWGLLFRREIHLTYRRIQDIHVRRHLVERWLGIGKVELQTASGSSSAELALEGMEHFAELRDYLYGRMRGTSGTDTKETAAPAAEGEQNAVALLGAIRDDLDGIRRALETREEA